YKAYWEDEDIGPADLAYRSVNGDDDGDAYHRVSNIDQRSYQLKSNEDDPALANYNDLATFIKVLNGKAGAADFNSAAFEQKLEAIFDVRAFLRWASVNNLLGAWDNYWGTPANYYLYNGGKDADFMGKPYFSWLPWDYDNSFGIDYFGIAWQSVGIVDWAKHTRTESHALPLVTNLLKNDHYLAYYLDHMDCMLDHYFNAEWIEKQIGGETGRGLWPLIKTSAFLESDTPTGAPHTGRQFTNDQVYWNGFKHNELRQGTTFILGIYHHVKARHDSAKSQIAHWRSERGLTAASEPVCE
ncbi:MAG TPA: CotH kinase family protein, partial [Polyangiaceae bacterium]|nr:CotH kinase family protein [Polyangiaceae bacterium]